MIRVLIVDDDPLVRAGLAMMLTGDEDVQVVGEAENGKQAITEAGKTGADVVLMDIRMPVLDGIEATRTVRERYPAAQVIVLTTFDADAQVLASLRAGAAGFLLKSTAPGDIIAAIRTVHRGDPILSPTITRTLIDHVSAPSPPQATSAQAALGALSDREREVAALVGQGLANAEIGAQVHLSVATVKAYVSRMLTALDLTNRVQLALLVHEAGLAPGDSNA